MRTIALSNVQTVEVECLSCALTSGMIEPDGGVIFETEHFHAHQDVAYPIEGLVILASKRHFKSVDEMTGEEQVDYIRTLTNFARHSGKSLESSMFIIFTMKTRRTISIRGWCRDMNG